MAKSRETDRRKRAVMGRDTSSYDKDRMGVVVTKTIVTLLLILDIVLLEKVDLHKTGRGVWKDVPLSVRWVPTLVT